MNNSKHSDKKVDILKETIPSEERKRIRKESYTLGWPVVIGEGMNQSVILVSRMMINRLGEESLAGVGIGQMIFFALVVLLGAVGIGVVALVAREVGGGNRENAGRVLKQALIVGSLFSALISLFGILFSKQIFLALGSEEAVVREGSKYMKIMFLGLVPMGAGFFLGAGMRGAGDTRTPMMVAVIMNIINIFLQYILIFGKLGLPKLGITGAAIATVISFSFSALIFLALFALKLTVIPMSLHGWNFEQKTAIKIFRIGIPTALEWELIQVGLIAFVSIVNHYGTKAAAAYIIGITILPFAQLPAFAFQAATTTLVGQSLGAKNFIRAEACFRENLKQSFLAMCILGIVLYFLAPSLIKFFFATENKELERLAIFFTKLIALTQPMMAISFTVSGGLRGAADTLAPLVAQSIGMYGGRLGIAIILWKFFRVDVQWLWLSMFPDFFLRIIIVLYRLRSGKWKKVKV